jgi:hypothetical protein
MKDQKKNKIWIAIKKTLKPSHLIFLILLLVGNSFAWFIYSKQVNNNVTVHVRSWKILLESGTTPVASIFDITVANMYPGMTNFSQDITAYNKSDMAANVSYTILDLNMFGVETKTKEGILADGGTLTGDEKTSAELATELANNYPFKITFTVTSETIDAEIGQSTYTVGVVWPYESGDDVADTTWGTRAYDYKTTNPDSSSITMKVKISVVQQE